MHIEWRFNRDSAVDANNSADNCRHHEKKPHTQTTAMCKSKREKELFSFILSCNQIHLKRTELSMATLR